MKSAEQKEKVRRKLMRWRKKDESDRRYRKEKQEYKKLCEKKKKKVERMHEVKDAKTEGQVWKIVKGERKGRKE